MIEIPITESMKKRAWHKARSMGKLKNSILQGEGNIAGFLGEEGVNDLIDGIISNTYDYDIVIKLKVKILSMMLKQKDAPLPQNLIMNALLRLTTLSKTVTGTLLYE